MLIEYYDHKNDKYIQENVDNYYDSYMDISHGELVVKYAIDIAYKKNNSYDVLKIGEKRFPHGYLVDRKLKSYFLIEHNGIITLERKSMPNRSTIVRITNSIHGRSFNSIPSKRRCYR